MNNQLQVMTLQEIGNPGAMLGTRPVLTSNQRAMPQIITPRGLRVNSMLRKDEWEELDRAVVAAAVPPLRVIAALERAGLTSPLGSLGTLVSQYNVVSEMTAANANLRGHAAGDKDLVDFDIRGVPVPVIFKEFELDAQSPSLLAGCWAKGLILPTPPPPPESWPRRSRIWQSMAIRRSISMAMSSTG